MCTLSKENHLDNLSALFFGLALDQMGQKCRYLAKNASFGPNLAVFGPKIHFFDGPDGYQVSLGFGPKNSQIWPKIGFFGQILAFLEHLVNTVDMVYTRLRWLKG